MAQKNTGSAGAVILDHTNRRVLEMLKSREKAVVVTFLRESQYSGLLGQVTKVTSDIGEVNVAATREVFGESVTPMIGHFHVMKNLQEQLTAERREIQHDLPAVKTRELKCSRWL